MLVPPDQPLSQAAPDVWKDLILMFLSMSYGLIQISTLFFI